MSTYTSQLSEELHFSDVLSHSRHPLQRSTSGQARSSSSKIAIKEYGDRALASAGSPMSSRYFDSYPKKSTGLSDRSNISSEFGEIHGQSSRHKAKSRSIGKARNSRSQIGENGDEEERYHTFPMLTSELDDWPVGNATVIADDEQWQESIIPAQHSSGSSTFTRAETPPYTPIDAISVRGLRDPVHVVAAPIAGVETMDALVEGMTGFDDDDFYKRPGIGSRSGKIGHHPLYHPPLPTPPPGVILGYSLQQKDYTNSRYDEDSESFRGDSLDMQNNALQHHDDPEIYRSSSSRPVSSLSGRSEPASPKVLIDNTIQKNAPITPVASQQRLKTVVPSISEIIRRNASQNTPLQQFRLSTAQSSFSSHTALREESESEPEPLTAAEEAELLSRSSIDSVAEEVQQTLLKQRFQSIRNPDPHTINQTYTYTSETSSSPTLFKSSRSENYRGSSIYSSSTSTVPSLPTSPVNDVKFVLDKKQSAKEQIATYLKSKRMTTLLHLTRSPHASVEQPLTVSLCDLGSPTGFPLVVFLGLGCVRYVMGLYDEMAECLGLRLIAIDRWGLGRTGGPNADVRGIPEWATVVDEVLELLQIDRCSVLAHSAGAPYALSFSSRYPSRIKGDICLLAPWVGGGEASGYKWLKYIPSGLIKTAQAAEWKVQAWMIGKPPTVNYEPVGYSVKATSADSQSRSAKNKSDKRQVDSCNKSSAEVYPSASSTSGRQSLSSGSFSEYDDLKDFGGRFESRSTLGPKQRVRSPSTVSSFDYDATLKTQSSLIKKRKPSKGFLRMLKGGSNVNETPDESKISFAKRLKAPRSTISLRSRSKLSPPDNISRASSDKAYSTPPNVLDQSTFSDRLKRQTPMTTASKHLRVNSHSLPTDTSTTEFSTRSNGRRSISFTASSSSRSYMSSPPLRSASAMTMATDNSQGSSYQTALGNALIAASHSESSKGTHNDLLQILNHERKPWGFSYSNYPHKVRIWYGDKDERIAENAVRWMERTMGEDMCRVVVVKDADHGLLYRSSVVVDVLERIRAFWRGG